MTASKIVLTLFLMAVLSSGFAFSGIAYGQTFNGWQIPDAESCSDSDGVITLSYDSPVGTTLYTYISPQTDFEISLQVKAETLGEVNIDPPGGGVAGAGEGFMLLLRPNASVFDKAIGINFEFRARGGGQFLVLRHNDLADAYGWPYDWTPFVYNSLEYNDGSDFWQYSSPEIRANAPVKPDVWYTMRLSIQQTPFIITAKVLTENGTLVGSFPISDMNNFGFEDIRCVCISSAWGGIFYVSNFTMNGGVSLIEPTIISISAEPSITLGSPVDIHGSLTNGGLALANELIMLTYSFPGAEEWYPIGSTYTDADGNYNAQWINTATGTFTLKAEWKGNNSFPEASATVTLNSLPSQVGVFFVESNSTVNSLAFNSTSAELHFTVSGPNGTSGYVKATVAKSLLPDGAGAKVYLDGKQLSYELQETLDSWVFAFSYQHSAHIVTLDLKPDWPAISPFDSENSVLILGAIAASCLILLFGIFIQKKRRPAT